MRLWQLPARALPVTLRPLGGETVISYTRRLSEANGLASTAIMRALGQVIPGSGSHLLDHDAWLNDQAIARLEALSALPRHRLATALPARRWGPPPLVPAAARRQPRPALLPPLAGRPAGLPVLRAARLWRHRRDGPGPAAGITAALPPSPALARPRRRDRADRHLRRPRDPYRAPALPAAPGPQRRPGLGRRQHRRGVGDHDVLGARSTPPAPALQPLAGPSQQARPYRPARPARRHLPRGNCPRPDPHRPRLAPPRRHGPRMAARLVLPAHRPPAWRALPPGTLPKRPDRHLGRRAPQEVRPDPQLLEQA